MRNIILSILVLLIAASCQKQQAELLLDEAEALMSVYPDSAYQQLQNIDVDKLEAGSEQQARYALLYTRGQYKQSEEVASDSLITLAADYYENHGNEAEKFQSYLYQGIVRYHLSDLPNTTASLHRALAHVSAVDSHYQKGLLYTYLALVNGAQNCLDEEKYAARAYQEYKLGRLDQYSASALTIWAVAKMHAEDYDSCRILFDASIKEAHRLDNKFVMQEAVSGMAQFAILVDSMELAEQLYVALAADHDYTMTVQDLSNLALVYANYYLKDSALSCLRQAEAKLQNINDTIGYFTKAYWTHLYLGDEKTASALRDSLLSSEEQLLYQTLQNKSLSSLNDYTKWQLLLSERDNRYKTVGLIGLFFCLLLLLLAFFAIYREKQTQILLQEQKIKNLQLELGQNAELHISNLAAMKENPLVQNLREMAQQQGTPHVDWQAIDALFEQKLSHFGKALKELVSLNETEWRVCLLLKLGFSPRGIAQLVNRSPEAISSIRRRLYSKVFQKKGTPSDWDTFVESL